MGGKSGGGEAALARQDELDRQTRIREGTQRVNSIFDRQFNDGYFNEQRDAYVNYATPQLDDQRGEANKELIFAMDRGGQLDGSARASLAGELQKKYNLQRQKIQDDALNFRTSAMTNVEDARSNLVATLNATGDAQGAANSALSRAAALSQPAAYNPISNLFADFTGTLGTQAAAERAYSYGGPAPTYTTGWFGPKAGSVSVKT